MLPRQERLTRSSEFAYVYHQKHSVANSLLVLYVGCKKKNELYPTRAGFIVGKKVHKSSVKRNRIKRVLREIYKNLSNGANFPLKDFQQLIFLARPDIIEADTKQVYDAVVNCVNRAAKKFQ